MISNKLEQEKATLNDEAMGMPLPIPGEFDILSMFRSVWRQAWVVAVAIILSLCVAATYLRLASYEYDINLTVFPVQSGQSSSSRNLSGLASMAGINLSGNSSRATFDLYLAGLTSRPVAAVLARDQEIMRGVFSREWSSEKGQWLQPNGLLSNLKRFVMNLLGVPKTAWQAPDAARLHEYLRKEIKIEQDKESSLVTISMRSPNPALARSLLMKLHQTVDAMLRAHALARSSEYVRYVNGKLSSVTVRDYREALMAMLSAQEQARMTASASVPYVAEPFGDAVSSPKPTAPNPMFVLIGAIVLGTGLGVVGAYALDRWRIRRHAH